MLVKQAKVGKLWGSELKIPPRVFGQELRVKDGDEVLQEDVRLQ